MQTFWSRHLLPLCAAVLLSFFVTQKFPGTFINRDTAKPERASDYVKFGNRHFVNLGDSPEYEREFYEDWIPQQPLVILGSSELTSAAYQSIPYNFFTDHGIPCIGIGSSGNQCLNILAQVATHYDAMKQSRLVVILSPGWFDCEYCSGTPLEKFLSANTEPLLYKLNDNMQRHSGLSVIDDYVSENLDAINSPSSVLHMMAYRSRVNRPWTCAAYYPFYAMHKSYMAYKSDRMNWWMDYRNFTVPEIQYNPVAFDFKAAFDSAQKVLLSGMTNNAMYIKDDYYTDWVKGKPLKKVRPVAAEHNHEYRDFCALVDFLKAEQFNVMFVLQPYNPYAFANLPELDPTLNLVRDKVRSSGFFLADFYSSSTGGYTPGILADIHHLSEAGWYLVDEQINQHFFVKP